MCPLASCSALKTRGAGCYDASCAQYNNCGPMFVPLLQGNQILSGLSLDEYKATLKMIERAILATDLALYMK